MEKIRLCLDVGGTYIKYGLFSLSGELLEKGKLTTNSQSVESFFFPIIDLTEKINLKYDIQDFGLSFPGFINTKTGVAIYSGAITPLHGKNICAELSTRLPITCPIFIENDANCAALAEMHSGNAQSMDSFVVITLGTGVGGAIVVDNKIVSGINYRGGEFGMMIVDFQSNGYRTLHELASTSALMKEYRRVKGENFTREEDIFEELDNPQIRELVDKWAQYVAILIYNISVTLDPEKILIGGGISQNDLLLPIIREALAKNSFWKDFNVPLESCFYHNDSGLLGALYLIETQGGKK